MNLLYLVKKQQFVQVLILGLMALFVHALVLTYIFPGYYSPLYPHHSDFYIPVALANSPDDFFQYKYLGYSRPLGLLLLKGTGFFGVHGAILFTIFIVVVNCSLAATLARNFLKVDFTWSFVLGFCIYAYLLFSQAYFYTFYTQDVLAHFSFFFLLAGGFLYCHLSQTHGVAAKLVFFCFSVIAFLCKETYAFAALWLAWLFFLYYKKDSVKAALVPLLTLAGALFCVILFNLIIRSAFIKFGSTSVSDPYHINLSVGSVFNEVRLYAAEGSNIVHWIVLVATALLAFSSQLLPRKAVVYLLAGCFGATILSWLPNAFIPNHHNGGYSFNGAYLLYLPLVSLSFLHTKRLLLQGIVGATLVASLYSPILNKEEYEKQWWVLEQENIQRNLLQVMDVLMKEASTLKPGHKILVTGLTMPFFPFHHPQALQDYHGSRNLEFDVVSYSLTQESERDGIVKFIGSENVVLENYAEVWMFAPDGSLLRRLILESKVVEVIAKYNYQQYIINPDRAKDEKLTAVLKKL